MNYNTVQKKAIIDFLMKNKDIQFSVEDILEGMHKDVYFQNETPGKSTIYRLIQLLVDEGTVKRFVKGQSRRFLYQIAGCENHESHLHLKCMECGKLFHADIDVSEKIINQIMKSNSFDVNKEQTILYGRCSKCK